MLAPIGSHVNEKEKFPEKSKTQNLNIQKSTFVRTTEKNIQEKFERI